MDLVTRNPAVDALQKDPIATARSEQALNDPILEVCSQYISVVSTSYLFHRFLYLLCIAARVLFLFSSF
jgi:hypothetical protein